MIEVGLSLIRGTVREGEGGARVNISVVQGSLGDNPISFIVSTVNGSAQGTVYYTFITSKNGEIGILWYCAFN